ncbi:hypothetical protein LN042_12205 [Kitasatospora sp. RB6PN24]|uniref:baeRF2 domain-containing protein n=1 Tax=Kitasatospora humi TaxID=2893891 RepID=UPI001E28EA58|nr:hypothetical protein [Kitasatospora humi]MCC9307847.1 hypothetical protein [Kitasatospora humi]
MKLQFLNPLYAPADPVASVYLDTSRDIDDPDRAIERRWRHLRESLLAHDAGEATVDAVESVLGTDREIAGPHGQAVFAAAGRLLLTEYLPDPPVRDSACFGALPDALPLVLQHAPDLPYAAVAIRRVHLPEAAGGGEVLDIEYDIGHWPMGRVNAATPGWRTPVDSWPQQAEQFLAELAGAAESGGTEEILLAGDPWAANTMIRLAPNWLKNRLVRLKNGHHHYPQPGRAVLEDELEAVFTDRLPQRDRQQLDAFQAQRARDPEACEGLTAAVAALQRGQARTVLINRPVQQTPPLWVGGAPTDLARSADDLRAFGIDYYWEQDAGSAVTRAAAGTQAELVVVPREELPFPDGIAVLLRRSVD